jgi:predicted alpha/beta superfamily hydrolase
MMKLSCSLTLTAVIATFGGAATGFAQAVGVAKSATIWYSEQFKVHSKIVGRDFLIQIARPVRPLVGKAPVIYLLDGNALFGEVADMVITNGYFGDTAPAYVVGIGYPNEAFSQWLSLRNHDLVHVHVPDDVVVAKGSGEGAKFQKFLLEELRPLIERRYPVDAHRATLAGHSFGGLFALHLLLNTPGAFDDYLICSPAIWAETQSLEQATDFHTAVPLKVFIGIGSKEEEQFGEGWRMVKNAKDLAVRLGDHASGVEVKFNEFDGQTHGTAIPECLSRGLQFVLSTPQAAAAH